MEQQSNIQLLEHFNISPSRAVIIDLGVKLEAHIRLELSNKLGVVFQEEMISFDFGAQPIPFIYALNLYLDLGGIKSEDKDALILFYEVRNKFAHLYNLKTFKDLLDTSTSLKTKIRKRYHQSQEPFIVNKENANSIFEKLYIEIQRILEETRVKGDEEINKAGAFIGKHRKLERFLREMEKIGNKNSEIGKAVMIANAIAQKDMGNEIKATTTQIRAFTLYQEHMKEVAKQVKNKKKPNR